MKVAAIVPAAGASRRFGANKLWRPVAGAPLLVHALRVLQQHPSIRWIILPTRATDRRRVEVMLKRHGITKTTLCVGGASRAESVAKAFAEIPAAADWVLVHDGARPCLSRAVLTRSLKAAARNGAVACGLPASLTVKSVDRRGRVEQTLDRNRLWFVQTPQIIRRDWFAKALAETNGTLARYPDDVSIVEAAGFPVRMILGDPLNIKVTTKEDMVLAEAILRRWSSNLRHRSRRSG